jgi:hypothetical protein
MGLDVLMAREDRLPRSACRYQRLRGEGYDGGSPSSFVPWSVRVRRPRRLRRRACKAGGRWKTTASSGGGRRLLRLQLLFLVPAARRVAALFSELVRRLAVAASADCPSIVFSSQWGLPVLSHSASTGGRSARLRAFYLERSLSARSSSGAGSPCWPQSQARPAAADGRMPADRELQ